VFKHTKGDITLTNIRPYSGAQVKFNNNTEEMVYHCGVMCYNSNTLTLEFMKDWWEEFKYQYEVEPWPYPDDESLRIWDQYTFWRLLRMDKHKGIKIGIFEDDARWNFVNNYKKDEAEGEIIIYHHTLDGDKVYAGSIKD